MRIVNIGLTQLPTNKANGVSVTQTCNALVEIGHRCTLIVPRYTNGEVENEIKSFYNLNDNLDIHQLRIPNIPGRLYLFSLLAAIKAKGMNPDSIFGRNTTALYISTLISKIPVAIEIHSAIWTKKRLESLFFKRLIKKINCIGVFTNSLGLKKACDLAEIVPSDKEIIVCENGAKPPIKDLLDQPKNKDLFVGYFGSFVRGRGANQILEMARGLPNFTFSIYGVSSKAALDIGYSDIPNNLHFIGYVPHAELPQLRANCDILLAPYDKEVVTQAGEDTAPYLSPIKIFEYMSANRAIVATGLATLKDVLSKDMAILVEPGSSADVWIAAMQRLEGKGVRMQYAEKSYRHFLENYTWQHRAEKVVSLLSRRFRN